MRALLDVVAPIRCAACGETSDGELCPNCAAAVSIVGGSMCDRCGTPADPSGTTCAACSDLEGFRRARSLVVFAEPARSLTLALKRRGRRPLARAIGNLLAALADGSGLVEPDTVVSFVPAGRKARSAGFDHAELLAKATARSLGVPLRRYVVRVGDGPRQADVPFDRRRTNVRGRFAARPVHRPILLIDDVFTTGATAEAVSLALHAAGSPYVDVVTWARTLRLRRNARRWR